MIFFELFENDGFIISSVNRSPPECVKLFILHNPPRRPVILESGGHGAGVAGGGNGAPPGFGGSLPTRGFENELGTEIGSTRC